jgi:transporter family-2 protein
LVVQNAILLQVKAEAGSTWAALWLNTVVGLVLLSAIVLAFEGAKPFARLLSTPSWWFVAPGLLGAVFVFASLSGFARFGAGTTVGILIASQLGAAVIFDYARGDAPEWATILGVMLLVSGATLIARDL